MLLTMGSLFDGIGGFPLAAVHNGIVPLWASEIEAFPIEVTRLRFPNMVHVGDITKLDGAKLPPVVIICGGSPCQDYTEETVIPKLRRKARYRKIFPLKPRNNKSVHQSCIMSEQATACHSKIQEEKQWKRLI